MKQPVSPATLVVAVIVAALVIGGLWYKFLGPGSQSSVAPDATPTPTEQAGEPKLDPKAPGSGQSGGAPSGVAGEPVLR